MISKRAVSNAYLQGKEVDRVILYRIPKGGIPGRGIAEGAVIAARVFPALGCLFGHASAVCAGSGTVYVRPS